MQIDPALLSIVLTLVSLFSIASKVRWLIRIGKWLLLIALVYAVIFVPQVKDFFVAVFDTVKHAINTILGTNF